MSSVETPARPAPDVRAPIDRANTATVPPPRHMWWMYLLVTFALAAMGGGAARALFVTRDLGGIAAVQECLAEHGITLADVTVESSVSAVSPFAGCAAPFNSRNGVAVLVGAGLVPVAAWLLMLCGGLAMRWRLRRSRVGFVAGAAAQDAADRFQAWCDVWNLTGRRRPELLLAAPGTSTGQAFTTGVPLARPLVVVPLGYAYAEPAQFDVVVLHELAHVRSRDLLWASSVWWAGWLNVPVLLLALGSALSRPQQMLAHFGSSLWLAAALSAGVLVSRAALLRRRELAADRYAVDVLGDIDALRAVLGHYPDSADPAVDGPDLPTPGAGGFVARVGHRTAEYVRQLTASHPAPAVRADADPAALHRWEGGFAVTAVTSLVAMFTFQSVDVVLVDVGGFAWPDPRLPFDLASATAGLLWAWVLIPAWARRVKAVPAGSSPTWWGPIAGTVSGLTVGYNLQIPGALSAVGTSPFAGHLLVLCGLLAIVAAAVGVLAAGLATSAAVADRRMVALTGAVFAAAVALSTALSVTVTVLTAHLRWASPAEDRALLMAQGHTWASRFAPLLLLIGFAVATSTSRRGADPTRSRWSIPARVTGRLLPRDCLPVMASATVVGGLGAALSWQLRIRPTLPGDTLYLLVNQRFWICAAAGWAATVVVLLTGRAAAQPGQNSGLALAGLPVALNTGLVTAALAGLLEFGCAAATGYGRNLHTLQESLRMPMWLLFVAFVVTLPLLHVGKILRNRHHARPGATTASTVATTVSAVAATAVIAATLALTLVSGALSALTVAPHDHERSQAIAALAAARPPTRTAATPPPAPTHDPGHAADPGRALDQAATTAALANIQQLLPGGKLIDNDKDTPLEIRPTACRDLFARDNAADNALPRTAAITRTYAFPAQGTSGNGVKVVLKLTSYTTPPEDFTTSRNEAAQCPHFALLTNSTDDGRIQFSIADSTSTPQLPYPSYRGNYSYTGLVHSMHVAGTGVTDSILIGHNLVSADISFSYIDVPPPAAVQQYPEQLTTPLLATIIKNLQTTPQR